MAGLTTDQVGELRNFKETFNPLIIAAGARPQAHINRVAVVDRGGNLKQIKGSVSEELFDSNRRKLGDIVTYVLTPIVNTMKDWPQGVSRTHSPQRTTFVKVRRKRKATDLSTVYKLGDAGLIGMVETFADTQLETCQAVWDEELAQYILTNPLLDNGTGKRFYDVNHPIDPLGAVPGVQNNVISTAAGLTEDEVIKGLAQLASLRWLNGITFVQTDIKAIAFTGNYALYLQLKKFQRGTMVGKEFTTGAAPESNIIQIEKALTDVVYIPALNNKSVDPNADHYIIYALEPNENQPAFMASPSQEPLLEITGLNDGDTMSVEQGAVGFGAVAFGGVAGALHQCTVRQTVTTI